MTPPKRITLTELRKEARRVLGREARVMQPWRDEVRAESDTGYIVASAGTMTEARRTLLTCLRALPSAGPVKKAGRRD